MIYDVVSKFVLTHLFCDISILYASNMEIRN